MAMRKSSRNYIHKRFDEINAAPERIEGFVGIIPQRKEFVGDLQKIIDANEGSSRANSKSCWIPFSEDFKAHRCELSDALRAVTETELGGYFQPMTGKDLILELRVSLPEKSRRMNRLNDIIQTLMDAMLFNAWTTDNKRLGLISERASVELMVLRKEPSLGADDPEGIHYAIYHEADVKSDAIKAILSERLDTRHINEDGSDYEVLDVIKLGIDREMSLRVSCLADKKTPLHPDVLRYYKALLERFDLKTARRLALYEQTHIDTTVLFDGERAAERALEEVRGRTDRLVESMAMRSPSVSEVDE